MFCVTPAGHNKFFVSRSECDLERMKTHMKEVSPKYVDLELCKVMELILDEHVVDRSKYDAK